MVSPDNATLLSRFLLRIRPTEYERKFISLLWLFLPVWDAVDSEFIPEVRFICPFVIMDPN